MSTISRAAYRPPNNRPRDFVIAVRGDGRYKGKLICGHCGLGGMAMSDFAAETGIPVRDVSAFLDRRTVRADIAAKIRANVLRVYE